MSSSNDKQANSSTGESNAKRLRIATKADSISPESSRSAGTSIHSQAGSSNAPWSFWSSGSPVKSSVATKLSLQTSVNSKELVPLLPNSVTVVNSNCKVSGGAVAESSTKPNSSNGAERHSHFIILPDPNTLCSSSTTSVVIWQLSKCLP